MEYAREEAKNDVQEDPKARELLRQAFGKTSRWPDGFGGFDEEDNMSADQAAPQEASDDDILGFDKSSKNKKAIGIFSSFNRFIASGLNGA